MIEDQYESYGQGICNEHSWNHHLKLYIDEIAMAKTNVTETCCCYQLELNVCNFSNSGKSAIAQHCFEGFPVTVFFGTVVCQCFPCLHFFVRSMKLLSNGVIHAFDMLMNSWHRLRDLACKNKPTQIHSPCFSFLEKCLFSYFLFK